MPAELRLTQRPSDLAGTDALLFIGRAGRLAEADVLALVPPEVGESVFRAMVRKTDPGDSGRLTTTWTAGSPSRVHVGVLPEACSRHNSPSRSWAIPTLVGGGANKGNVGIVLALDDAAHALASVIGVARALPTFGITANPVLREVRVLLLSPTVPPDPARLQVVVDAVRQAAHDTDEPPDTLNCDALAARAQQLANEHGASFHAIRGSDLLEHGLRGIYAVGKAATQSPALVVLDHNPEGAKRTVGWVGKGIVYDTGGLSIKGKTAMPGMKTDMAGAAAVLAAFGAAVQLGFRHRLVAALCIAENAVGPGALRPDDIVVMASGRSVEVNNTDAEGRIVLADGLCHVARTFMPDRLIDMATLTGAQAVATGKRHAGIVSSDEALELAAVAAGKHSGDLAHPLLFAPELLRQEFRSPVADMRNSVKDRNNAQSSCAAQFIYEHLVAVGYDKPWLHVDMAAPAVSSSQRGTGFGVGMLLALEGLL